MADIYYNRFVPALGAPQNVDLSTVGVTGSTTYKYQVTAYNWNGETTPCTVITITTGNALLSVSNYNYLEWDAIEGAAGYVIYGRLNDSTYGQLYKSQVADFISISGGTRIGFNDQGQNTPTASVQPPTEDTTGRQAWDRLLFRPNKAIQSAELNEIQAIQDYYMDNFGRAFFREGSVIRGCSPVIADDLVTVTISEGDIYIAGKVRYVAGGTITMGGSGAEEIGLLVVDNTVTESDDSALYDPAVGAYNYNKDGAHRRVYDFEWVINNTAAVKVFDVQDGAIIVASSNTDYAQLNKILAQRTYEESGNYVVDSTVVLVKEHASDITKLGLSVDALRAYVQGYRVERTKGAVLNLNKARDTKNVGEEQFNKISSTYVYQLATDFIKDVNSCYATMAGSGSFTKGTSNGQDFIHDSLVAITSVAQGGTTYTENVDWKRTGNNIDWSLGGSEPVTGTSYDVVYQYRKALTKSVRTKTTVTDEVVTRGSTPNTADDLAHGDLIDITSVVRISDGHIYIKDVDWYVVDGQEDDHIEAGKVHWNLPGNEPAAGETYHVTYTYWAHTTEGEFTCAGSYDSYPDIGTYGDADLRDSIDLRHPTGWSGTVPENDNVNVDYDYYLPRRDLLVVSTMGEISIIAGISDISPARPKPKEDTMALAELRLQAYTYSPGNVQVIMLETRRSTMEDIKTIEKRVNNIEYYQALDLLEKDAIDEYTIDAKSGVMVDNFKGSSRSDLWFEKGGLTFGVAFDTARECIQVKNPSDNIDLEDQINLTSSTVQKTGKLITLPYTNVIVESQPFASQKKNVTPYLVFPWIGNLILDPKEDYWVDTEQAPDLRVTTGATAEEMEFWTQQQPYTLSATPWETHITGVSRTTQGTRTTGLSSILFGGWRNTFWTGSASVTTTETKGYNERKVTQVSYSADTQIKDMGDRIVDTTISPYIRSKIISVTGEKLRASTEIALKMDDKVIAMVPISPTVAGSHSGCVMTDTTGKFTARFTIPAATFNTGERSVEVYDYSGDPDDDTSASAVYNAFGVEQTRQKTYLSATYIQPKTTVVSEVQQFKTQTQTVVRFPVESTDPLAQSFQYGSSFFMTQIGLFFATKDSTSPCTVQIRTMENGYPAAGILGTVSVYPSQITADETGVAETRITFPEPIFIEEGKWYCLCILANVTTYNVWIATLGANDITTGNLITKQPHNGTLFTSSNNVTWVADPNSDLKFKFYCADFSSTSADLYIDAQTVDASILSLSSTEVLPGNTDDKVTAITWYVDDNPPSLYDKVIRTNETTYINYTTPQVRLKATFTTNNNYLSPLLNIERLGLLHAKYETGTKSYITRNTDVSANPFDYIKIVFEANKPTNTNVRTYYSVDDGYTWTELVTPTSTRSVDDFWTEYQFLSTTMTDETQFRVRIDLISTTDASTPRVRKLRVIAY